MTSKEEIDHELTDDPVCPGCGAVVTDAWELNQYEEEWECENCERHFSIERIVTVEYSTQLIARPDEECEPEEEEDE